MGRLYEIVHEFERVKREIQQGMNEIWRSITCSTY